MSSALAAVPPGPALAALLAPIRPADVTDPELLELIHAQYRQLAYQQERFWAAVAELSTRAPYDLPGGEAWPPEEIWRSARNELRAELRISGPAAENELVHASRLAELPAVASALRAGELDRNKAVVLTDSLHDLSEVHRAKILQKVLPDAPTMNAGALRARVQKLAIALDPGWAERRYREAVRTRKVIAYLAEDGTATLVADGQPAELTYAAMSRLTQLANAAKLAGAHAGVDELRSAILLGLCTGQWVGRHESEILADLVATYPAPASEEPEQDQATSDRHESGSGATARPPFTANSAAPEAPRVADCGIELQVGIATLMGLTDEPGDIAGAGAVIADVARRLAEQQRRGEWRFAVVDGEGRPLFDGITRHRPTTYAAGGAKGGVVELHVPVALLDPALVEEHPTWAGLLRDVARQFARQAPIEQDPAARAPGEPLRRRIEMRHRTCVFPGCRRPATDSQIDHRHEYGRGGPTAEENLGPLCAQHHDLKTRLGWRLIKRDDHTYAWITPLGRRHVVKIEPIAPPLPPPMIDSAAHDPDPPDGVGRAA